MRGLQLSGKAKAVAWLVSTALATALLALHTHPGRLDFSVEGIRRTGVYPYAVLGLCATLLWRRRSELKVAMDQGARFWHRAIGLLLLTISYSIPVAGLPELIFSSLLLLLGVYALYYGEAALLPGSLTAIYGFAIAFPRLIASLGTAYPRMTASLLALLLTPFLHVTSAGQLIYLTDLAGRTQSYYIDAACSGSAALSVFLAIFFIMMLEHPLPWRRTAGLAAIGIVGTLAQNLLRLILLLLAGYRWGSRAALSLHAYSGYLLFTAWFGVFAYLYLRQAKAAVAAGQKGFKRPALY